MKYRDKEKISRYVFKIATGILFGYFGILALINPDIEAAKWLSPNMTSLIEFFIPVNIFILILGATQVLVALLFIVDKFSNIVLPIAMILLLGIIINLGLNEIALRDFTILTGLIYLYFSDKHLENKDNGYEI